MLWRRRSRLLADACAMRGTGLPNGSAAARSYPTWLARWGCSRIESSNCSGEPQQYGGAKSHHLNQIGFGKPRGGSRRVLPEEQHPGELRVVGLEGHDADEH